MKKQERIARFYSDMERLGFLYADIEILRRAQMTLHRWAERECNGEIERDETTGKVHPCNRNGDRMKYTVPDRETGTWKRIQAVVQKRNLERMENPSDPIIAYHQTDPRGCALYLVRRSELRGADIHAAYNRGFAVCI